MQRSKFTITRPQTSQAHNVQSLTTGKSPELRTWPMQATNPTNCPQNSATSSTNHPRHWKTATGTTFRVTASMHLEQSATTSLQHHQYRLSRRGWRCSWSVAASHSDFLFPTAATLFLFQQPSDLISYSLTKITKNLTKQPDKCVTDTKKIDEERTWLCWPSHNRDE